MDMLVVLILYNVAIFLPIIVIWSSLPRRPLKEIVNEWID